MSSRQNIVFLALSSLIAMGVLAVTGYATSGTKGMPSAIETVTATPEPGVFLSNRVAVSPVVDGDLSEWPERGMLLLDSGSATTVYGDIDDINDSSVACRSLWRDDMLFIGCQVLDDVLVADSDEAPWTDDMLELSFDGRNDNNSFCGEEFCIDDHKYEVRVDGLFTDNGDPVSPAVQQALISDSDGYNVEVAIPRSQLDTGTFVPGQVIGFNLGLIDDDDGGETDSHMIWMGQYTWDHAEDYGDLILEPGDAEPTPTPTPGGGIDIESAIPIGCGQSIAGNTAGAARRVNNYGCAPYWAETGPENVYALSLEGPTHLDMMLEDLGADLDLFLLRSGNPSSCMAYGDNAISIRSLDAGTFYLVVDGYQDAAGRYTLRVWCPLVPTPGPTPTPTLTATPGPAQPTLYLPVLLDG